MGVSDKSKPLKATEAWTPKVETNKDGSTTITAVDGESLTYNDLLIREGFDPKKYMLAPNGIQTKSWDALRKAWVAGDEDSDGYYETIVQRMTGYKLTVIERPMEVDVDDLIRAVESQPASTSIVKQEGYGATFLYAQADYQIGKAESDGAYGTIERIKETTLKAVESAKSDPEVRSIVIAFLGDHIEGYVSQGGRNAWKTNLTLTEQLRLVRRLYLMTIDAFVDAGYDDIRVLAVPGNHGETIRQPITTRADDNHDTDCLVAVADAMQLNPARYGGVRCYVPDVDEWFVCLEIEGVNAAFCHGNQYKPNQHWRWWEGQAFGQTPVGKCTALFVGHSHHTHIEERDVRTFAMAPSFEGCSEWFKASTGITGHPGALVAKFKNGEMEEIKKIHAKYRGKHIHD